VNIRIESLKVWHKFVLPWLKYSIFARGLFFIGTPCITCMAVRLGEKKQLHLGSKDQKGQC